VGHWEGDTLVVDTTNFNDKTQFRGSTENLHVIERFTHVDANTLLYRFIICRHAAISLHNRRPRHVGPGLERRVHLARDR
jgi:hypothetical protein